MSQASVFTFEEVKSMSVLHGKGSSCQRTPDHPSPVQEAGLLPVLPWINLPFGMETPEQGQARKLTGAAHPFAEVAARLVFESSTATFAHCYPSADELGLVTEAEMLRMQREELSHAI